MFPGQEKIYLDKDGMGNLIYQLVSRKKGPGVIASIIASIFCKFFSASLI